MSSGFKESRSLVSISKIHDAILPHEEIFRLPNNSFNSSILFKEYLSYMLDDNLPQSAPSLIKSAPISKEREVVAGYLKPPVSVDNPINIASLDSSLICN